MHGNNYVLFYYYSEEHCRKVIIELLNCDSETIKVNMLQTNKEVEQLLVRF